MALYRAINEFKVSRVLHSVGIGPCPVAVFKYDDLPVAPEISDANLGVVASQLPMPLDVRASLLFAKTISSAKTHLDSWCNTLACSKQELVVRVAGLFGESLRDFHKSGFFRFSGHLNNYTFDPKVGRVVLIDLDSVQQLETVGEAIRPLEKARDVASAMYGILSTLLRWETISADSESTVVLFSQTALSVLLGYSETNELADDPTAIAMLRSIATVSYHFAKKKHRQRSKPRPPSEFKEFEDYRRSRLRQYWIDRRLTYVLLMTLACRVVPELESIALSSLLERCAKSYLNADQFNFVMELVCNPNHSSSGSSARIVETTSS